MSNIIFWRISPSPHLDVLFNSMRQIQNNNQVYVVYIDQLDEARKQQGWSEDRTTSPMDIYEPNDAQISSIIQQFSHNSTHVFSGVIYHKKMRSIFMKMLKHPVTRILLNEGRELKGIKGKIRLLQGYWFEKRFLNKIDLIFAIGQLAVHYYSKLGVNKDKIRSFCYVINPPLRSTKSITKDNNNDKISFGVIGRLIPLKRVDILIQAFASISNNNWELSIIGDGSERQKLELLAKKFQIEKQIKFYGILPNHEVKALMANFDYTLFASNADGWGAVVNESMLAGTPVICSQYPGSADLIHEGFNGYLFKTDNLSNLIQVISTSLQKGKTTASTRSKIIEWSKCIQADFVANYFIEQLHQKSPTIPPWRAPIQKCKCDGEL